MKYNYAALPHFFREGTLHENENSNCGLWLDGAADTILMQPDTDIFQRLPDTDQRRGHIARKIQ